MNPRLRSIDGVKKLHESYSGPFEAEAGRNVTSIKNHYSQNILRKKTADSSVHTNTSFTSYKL